MGGEQGVWSGRRHLGYYHSADYFASEEVTVATTHRFYDGLEVIRVARNVERHHDGNRHVTREFEDLPNRTSDPCAPRTATRRKIRTSSTRLQGAPLRHVSGASDLRCTRLSQPWPRAFAAPQPSRSRQGWTSPG